MEQSLVGTMILSIRMIGIKKKYKIYGWERGKDFIFLNISDKKDNNRTGLFLYKGGISEGNWTFLDGTELTYELIDKIIDEEVAKWDMEEDDE